MRCISLVCSSDLPLLQAGKKKDELMLLHQHRLLD